jgi:hypothetical protein
MRVEIASGYAHILVRANDAALARLAAERAIRAIHDTLDPPVPEPESEPA